MVEFTDFQKGLVIEMFHAIEPQLDALTLKTSKVVIIDIQKLCKSDDATVGSDASQLFFEQPKTFAVHLARLVADKLGSEFTLHFKNIASKRDKELNLRIKSIYDPAKVGRLIQTEGIVKSMTFNDSRAVYALFVCRRCGNEQGCAQDGFRVAQPPVCTVCGEHGVFRATTVTRIPYSILEVEELPENDDDSNSTIMLFAEGAVCELLEQNQVKLGSRVSITAYVDYMPKWSQAPQDYDKSAQKVILSGNFIELLDDEVVSTTITAQEDAQIREIAASKDCFERLTASIAPNLLGMERIKEAVLYAMVGGVRRSGVAPSRGIINLLLVSDPSSGKTTMFDYIKKISPKCRKVSGGATTKAGLSAGAVRSEITGKFSIEAGALIMANKGILVIDELDKMNPEDIAALHESMESCTVTKSIVGQNRTFNSETAIIAGCNPKAGRFDDYDPITKQINIIPSLLSRFDAIFVMRDTPNEERDSAISTRIFKNYASPESIEPSISPKLFKKYITMCKSHNPKIPDDPVLEKLIKDFYVSMRKLGMADNGQKTISIATRHAESILRYAEASARIRLSDKVNADDICRAINIIKGYLMEFGYDKETGKIDIDRIDSSISASERSKAKQIINLIAELSPTLPEGVIDMSYLFEKTQEQIPSITEHEYEEIINKLSRDGEIFFPRANLIKKV